MFCIRQHDPETAECSPGGTNGNYIMYARATSGDRPNNNKFSSCSKKSMADVMTAKARGEDGCFIGKSSTILRSTHLTHLLPMDYYHIYIGCQLSQLFTLYLVMIIVHVISECGTIKETLF